MALSPLSLSKIGFKLPNECLCQFVSTHAHTMPTSTSESVCVNQKLLHFTFELNEKKKNTAYTDHTKAKQVHFVSTFVLFQLRTAFTIALLICLACSKV